MHQFVSHRRPRHDRLCSLLFADVPPFVLVEGKPLAVRSMNFEGLKRRAVLPERIAAVKADAQGCCTATGPHAGAGRSASMPGRRDPEAATMWR
jgi:acyl-[acyl carrier protein]--UDP-N-acetylglucosamine O-acyltransferase